LLKHDFRTSISFPVITVFQIPSEQLHSFLLKPLTKCLFNVIPYTPSTSCVLQVTIYAAVDMKAKTEQKDNEEVSCKITVFYREAPCSFVGAY
jgi:hypothetical protein